MRTNNLHVTHQQQQPTSNNYTTTPIATAWDQTYTLALWAHVETALIQAQAQHGHVPQEWADLATHAPAPTVANWQHHLQRTRHEYVAFLEAWGLRHIHIGATSSDIIDTANALRYKNINDTILTDTYRLREDLREQALRHAETPRLGRTHGRAATPTTYGAKYADLAHQAHRAAQRLSQARHDLEKGMLNGPTGGYHHIDPETEHTALTTLGLQPAGPTTQIIARDSLTHYTATLIGIVQTCAALATEIRLGTIQGIDEYTQQKPEGYTGSSAMPTKNNPTDAERITGLARIARQIYPAIAESTEQWWERDISQSSVERTLMPQLTGITHYCIRWARQATQDNQPNPTQANRNINQASDTGTHTALTQAQTAGMSYLDARIEAQRQPTTPAPPRLENTIQQTRRLGAHPGK